MSHLDAEPLYLRPEELAHLLGVSAKTLYRWATTDPTMPVLRLGGVVRFPRERVLRWLRDREQGLARTRHQTRKQVPDGGEVPVTPALTLASNGSCAAACAEEGA